MKFLELNLNISPGISFISSPEWGEFAGDYLVPSENYSQIIQNLKETLNPDWTNIEKKVEYIGYIEQIFAERARNNIPIPHKAWIQLEMAKLGINEDETRIVPTNDISTAFHYGLHLLDSGHTVIWMGTADIDDESDPQGDQHISPPLYKNIRNKHDLLLNLACAIDFAKEHPNSFLKIFPQDGPKPAIGSVVVAENPNDPTGNWFHLKIRKGEYTTSERKPGDDKPIAISIEYATYPLKIFTNQSTKETMHWLQIMFNSQGHFKKLDQIGLKGSDYVNDEFLIFQDGIATKINLFTDIIWGSKSNKLSNRRCPSASDALTEINRAISRAEYLIIPEAQSETVNTANGYMFAVLNTIKSARTNSADSQTAQLLLKLRTLRPSHLPYKLPDLSTRTIKHIEYIARGSRGYELDDIIMDLENQLRI